MRNKEVEEDLARGQHRKNHLLIFSARGENRPACLASGTSNFQLSGTLEEVCGLLICSYIWRV